MFETIRHLRERMRETMLMQTTFCDECAQVCTPRCRHEAMRRDAQLAVYRSGFRRF